MYTEWWSLLCKWAVGSESFSNVERLNVSYSHKKLKRKMSVGCWNHWYDAIKKWKAGIKIYLPWCWMPCLWISCCIRWWHDSSDSIWTKIKHLPCFTGWYRTPLSWHWQENKEEWAATSLCALLSTQWNPGDIGEKADQGQWEGWWAQQGKLKRCTCVISSLAPA